jgi:pSer/pThr/pTyr-binding forkhead associated (FHA) protein/outer membrane biosynthesis protein TonB
MEAKATSTIPVRLDVLGADGEVVHTSEFVKEKIVLGRILSADLRVDDPRVSRIHALIEVRGDTILLTDLASTHGTFVNGDKIVESKIKPGDVIKIGTVEISVLKGSGKVTTSRPVDTGRGATEIDETQVDIDRSTLDKLDRRGAPDRRLKDAFPDERRLEERRDGDRRIDQRQNNDRRNVGDRREEMVEESTNPHIPLPPPTEGERRKGAERRAPRDGEKRVGDRRRGDRRVFDITSLERRIEDRRNRKGDDDILPEELEKAFESPDHSKELEVTALWGDHILDVSNYYFPIVLNVGESPRNDYIIPSTGIPDEFPLVTVEDDGSASLAFTGTMSGTVRARDKIYTIQELKEEKFVKKNADYFVLPLKQEDFAKLNIGNVSFFILYVKPAPRIKPAPFLEKDPLLMRTTIGSALLLLLFVVSMMFVPKPKPVTIEMIPERFAKIVIKQRPVIPPVKAQSGIVAKNESDKQGGSVMGEGGRPQGEEGRLGKPELPDKKEVPQAVRPKSTPKETPKPPEAKPAKEPPNPNQRKVVDKDKVKSVGLLKAFAQGGVNKELKDLINSKEGPEGSGGFDDFGKAVTGLRGKSIEEVGGAGGKGLKGVDVGGGGKTVGIDGPSTKGLGRGYHGDGIGEGISGPGRLGIKGESAISIISENVQVLSGLPKDVINAVVQRHRAEIRACYDAALQRNPNLRGKVSIAFNIQPNGVVSYAAVKESTLGDGGLDNCIVSRVKTWQFPKPEAPVVTEVTAYPFYLNPAN